MSRSSAAQPLVPPYVRPAERLRRFPLMLPIFLRNPLQCIPRAVYEQPLTLVSGPPARAYVCSPELVKEVLLDRREEFPKTRIQHRVLGPLLGNGILLADGEDWRSQRQAVAPLFRHAEILEYVPVMAEAAAAQIARWRDAPPSTIHAIDQAMSRVTFEIISRTMLAGGGAQIREAMSEDGGTYLSGLPWALLYAVFNIPDWVPRPGRRAMQRREFFLRGVVRDLVQQRRKANGLEQDLLARLMADHRTDTSAAMPDEQMVDTLLTFLIAGHDTTAKTLMWALYLLSRSPHWQDMALAEIGSIAPAGPITSEQVTQLQIVTQIVKETLRLFPSAPQLTRWAAANTTLAGQHLAAHTIIDVPIYAIHRHRRLWRAPDVFDPDRFSPAAEEVMSRYQFMPFGAGPRVCIGAAFALIESTVLLTMFLRDFSFACPPGFEPLPVARITLGSANGMPMSLRARSEASAAKSFKGCRF